MTLETNKALVRRWIEAWMVNDLDTLEEIFARDYTVNKTPVGVDGVKQAVRFLHYVLSDISAEVHEIVAEEDKVVIRWSIRGRHVGDFMGVPPTGKELDLTGINIYQIVDHKISANHEQTNISEVLRSLTANTDSDVP